jgi:hypothetical protein
VATSSLERGAQATANTKSKDANSAIRNRFDSIELIMIEPSPVQDNLHWCFVDVAGRRKVPAGAASSPL